MADFGYRSPQFSEDAAWLPPWLQPALIGSQGNRPSGSLLRSEDAAYLDEVMTNRKNSQLLGENAKYVGCQLYLSGDDDTPDGGNSQIALNFRLHLSSDSVSATTLSQLDEVHYTGKNDKRLLLVQEFVTDNPVIQDETTGQKQADVGGIAQDVSPVDSLSRPAEKSVKSFKKGYRKRLQNFHANLENYKSRDPDVKDAIELSIAASEAMAISDIISNGQLESLPVQNILEIALHVKDQRKACDLDMEIDSASTDDVDESDQLLDLDERIMEDAYNDVGFTVTEIAESHEEFYCGRDAYESANGSVVKEQFFLQSNFLSDTDTHISETPCHCDGEAADKDQSKTQELSPADKDEFETQEYDKDGRPFRKYNSFGTDTKISFSEPPEQQVRPVCASVPSLLPDHHDQSVAPIQLAKTADDIAETKFDPKGRRGVLLDNFSRKGNSFLSKSMKGLLNWETSYISESNDFTNESQLQKQTQEEKPEEISSSNTPIRLYVCTKVKEGSQEQRVSSHDPVQLCSISSVDPICSFVPCSFASDNDPKIHNCNKKLVGEDGQSSNERVALPQRKEGLSFSHLVQDVDNDSSKFFPDLPICEQFKSLKSYSACASDMNKAKNSMLPDQQVSLPNITEKISELLAVKRNQNNSVCFEDEFAILKYMKKCGEVTKPYADGSKHSYNLTRKDKENIGFSQSLETVYDELPVLNDEHKNIVVNIKKRRHQACQAAVNNDDISVERYSTLGMAKRLSHKRVHFLEIKGVNHSHDTRQKMKRRLKELNPSYKNRTIKGILKSGIRCMLDRKEMIFYGLEFLLTGFSSSKEKELEALISQHGGCVLHNVPARPSQRGRWKVDSAITKFPIVLSPKKVKSTKFLYGCAINTWTLEASWLFDAVQSGSILPPWNYMVRPIQLAPRHLSSTEDALHIESDFLIFKELGAMLYGKISFYNKFSKIIKHGGGQVFKSLQQLIQSLKVNKNTLGVVLVEREADVSRHLKHCVSEHGLQIVPDSWIINSLFSGKLLPLKNRSLPFHRIKTLKFSVEMSQEI